MKFYVDSCVWLNIFMAEVSPFGKDFEQIARAFFEFAINTDDEIFLSSFVLKEIRYVLSLETFNEVNNKINEIIPFTKHLVSQKEYSFAKELEKEFNYAISFFDCVHLSVCLNNGFVLVTRDNLLIKKAKGIAKRPEDLIH
jgi:predicted nucleic acid-binding protein